MSAIAVLIMVVTILLVWGGLVASVVLLQVLPVPPDDPAESSDRLDGGPGEPEDDGAPGDPATD